MRFIAVFVCFFGLNGDAQYTGQLTPSCVPLYNRIILTRLVPPRSYLYYHEVQHMDEDGNSADGESVNPEDLNFRIVGGKMIAIRQAPYQVMYGPYCAGTLISPEWVLTAAHCKAKANYISAGSTYRTAGTKYTICAHFVHPLWSKEPKLHSHDYDYQLLLLEVPVPVTPDSRPIAIGKESDIKPGALVTVTGWGYIRYKGRMSDQLNMVKVPVLSSQECRRISNKHFNISDRMFCAGYKDGGKDACQGDSGGPAVIGGRLVGSVSFGLGCADPGKPGVYADVTKMRPWIRAITTLPL